MYLLAGLGNPGHQYEMTRHNVGFLVLNEVASKIGSQFNLNKKYKGELADATFDEFDFKLLKPQTFMNLSGTSVGPLASFFKIPPHQIIVIHDEVDLPFGSIRIKKGGGNGGHNGLKSIEESPVGKDFFRIRVGVGRPPEAYEMDISDHVLGKWKSDELGQLDYVIEACIKAVEILVRNGLKAAQNEIHSLNFSIKKNLESERTD